MNFQLHYHHTKFNYLLSFYMGHPVHSFCLTVISLAVQGRSKVDIVIVTNNEQENLLAISITFLSFFII